MNKSLKLISICLITSILIGDIIFIVNCGLLEKSITSFLFVVLGFIYLLYARKHQFANKNFAYLMMTGLIFAMFGDILLEIEFIIGAILFAVGHIFYFFAYSSLKKINKKDFLFSTCIFIPALIIILCVKLFDFGGLLMQIVCIIYALIISLMVGKAISNLTSKKSLLNYVIVIGSCLFFFSDFMLLFSIFANVSIIFKILCLATYYPAEILLATSILKSNS